MIPHKSRWYASKREFAALLFEDFKIRKFIKKHPKKNYAQAGIDRIEIERTRDEVKIVLYVARPGLIIGKKGQDVEILQEELQNLTGRRVNLKIEEIARPEIMAQLIAEGMANKQTADQLNISIKTVEKHRGSLMNKLDIHDTASLTRYAISTGIIESSVQATTDAVP